MSQEQFLEFDDNRLLTSLFGEHNSNLAHMEKKFDISISSRGNILRLEGEEKPVKQAKEIFTSLYERLKAKKAKHITTADFDSEIRFINNKKASTGDNKNKKKAKEGGDSSGKHIVIKTRNKTITPRSPRQARYIELIKSKDMVFGLGPAGTGKTYLAVAVGVDMYLRGEVEKLIFCRPAVEAGENLGFLPGDMKEKIDPYLRPVYDALHDMLPWDFLIKKMEEGEIEIAPLAFMRGRTLSRSFVILDEAQNATSMQVKMFLTRMGEASHMVITGDMSQSDLPINVKSGLNEAVERLSGIDDIGFISFEQEDVIRHHLVKKIIQAYDKND